MHGAHNTEHDAPYWRGPIWFNINFLALRSLHHYSQAESPYAAQARKLHSQLRNNLLSNLVRADFCKLPVKSDSWEMHLKIHHRHDFLLIC